MRLSCADAVAQGVQPEQIIFTDVAMKNEHIKRSALAYLFLDTLVIIFLHFYDDPLLVYVNYFFCLVTDMIFMFRPLCNAHTTGTDILWAGLPMITLPLEKMATRVAGSLCLATGLGDEMIVSR